MFEPLKRYWKLYGGWTEFLRSSYLYAAMILTAVLYPLWATNACNPAWIEMSVSILPNLMGFTVAGMAIMLAFSHPASLKAVTKAESENSYFLKTVANLFHFLIVQTVALIIAITAKAFSFWVLYYFGVLSLIYAILVSVAAAGQLFNTARIINKAASK